MIKYGLLFLLLVALISLWRFGPRLTFAAPAINWRRVGYSALTLVAVAAVIAAVYYLLLPAASTLQDRGIDLGGWMPAINYWWLALLLPIAAAIAAYLFGWIAGRTLAGLLLAVLAIALLALVPWATLWPEWAVLPALPDQAASLAPWAPLFGAALLALLVLYLFGLVGKKKLAGVGLLAVAVILLLLAPWSRLAYQWTATTNPQDLQCAGSDWKRVTLTASLFDIQNKDGHCRVDIRQETAGCIVIKRYNGELRGPFCPGKTTTTLPKNMVAMGSLDGTVKIAYKLFPP